MSFSVFKSKSPDGRFDCCFLDEGSSKFPEGYQFIRIYVDEACPQAYLSGSWTAKSGKFCSKARHGGRVLL